VKRPLFWLVLVLLAAAFLWAALAVAEFVQLLQRVG
jgi:hypothetical protein